MDTDAPDAEFLSEVEAFLTSCEVPLFPPIPTINTDPEEFNSSPSNTVKREHSTKKHPRRTTDLAKKRELAREKDRKRRSAYRARRHAERMFLQQQVAELSSKLEQWQESKNSLNIGMAPVWEMIARRQLQARLTAEEEQRQLLAAIDARATMIHAFNKFVLSSVSRDDSTEGSDEHRKSLRPQPSDAEFYTVYLGELEAIYARTNDVLRAGGLYSTGVDWENSKQRWRDGAEAGSYLYVDKCVVPFDLQQTCASLWRMSHMPHRQEDRPVFDSIDENTVAYTFRRRARLKSGRAVSMRVRVVTRRHEASDSETIVWRTFTEGEGIFTGLHADETGWVLATPLDDEDGTLLRICIQHVPMHFSHAMTREPDVEEFNGLVRDATSEDGAKITSALLVENAVQ